MYTQLCSHAIIGSFPLFGNAAYVRLRNPHRKPATLIYMAAGWRRDTQTRHKPEKQDWWSVLMCLSVFSGGSGFHPTSIPKCSLSAKQESRNTGTV